MDMTDQAVELYYGARRGDVREVQRFALRRSPPARRALRAHFLAGASGAGATVLAGLVIPPHPARGLPPAALVPEDLERLRGLLDRNLTRAG